MKNTEEKKVRIILFSKDRGLQLEACLSSLFRSVKSSNTIRLEVVVIFKASVPLYSRQYKLLENDFPEVVFIEENSFKDQFLGCLENSDYSLFLVDDTIFFRPWSLDVVIHSIDSFPRTLGFSLRLGKNITYCYPFQCVQRQPDFQTLSDGVIRYSWPGMDYDFGYPFEVSSSLYRTEDVIQALQGRQFGRPNELERELAKSAQLFEASKPELLLFDTSVAFACPINLVQEHRGNLFGKQFALDVQTLAERFEEGFRIDLGYFESFLPISCHQEVEIKFLRPDESVTDGPC